MRIILLLLITCSVMGCDIAHAHAVDLHKIGMIESSGGKNVVGDNGRSLGRYQIQKALVQDFNRVERKSFTHEDMLNDSKATIIANWAFSKYFPIILKQLGEPVSVDNLLICWNAGCGALKRADIPQVTKNYLEKYKGLTT